MLVAPQVKVNKIVSDIEIETVRINTIPSLISAPEVVINRIV